MKSASFNNLPDDLILDVIGQLNTARDISALATSSQRTYSLVHQDGWRSFVRQGFPRVNLPPGGGSDWRSLAGRLTYLDRCWERRAFLIHDFQEVKGRGRRFNAPLGGQSVSFYPALDARLVSSEDRELATWGAGEDLITRLGGTGGDKHAKWHRLEGSKSGYRGGFGDVTAVSIIDRGPRPEILVGRANGDMKLMEATGDDMGTVTQNLHPTLALKNGGGASTPRKSPGQIAVSWTEWDPLSNMVASGRHSSIMLHDLNKAEEQDLSPVAYYDFLEDGPIDEPSLVRGIKFLNDDTIACSLGGSRRPLRWGKITPTGVEFFDAADNYTPLEYLASQTEISWDEKTTVRAIEKVGHGSSESLLLSAWDDGTYRLLDIRTPSPYDAVYRDRWNPYDGGSSLLVYGTQRFVAGDNMAPSIRLYDFRYPKPYHHSDGLACSPDLPSPRPPFRRADDSAVGGPDQCLNQGDMRSCNWHAESRRDVWRPDSTLHLGDAGYDRVHALAKASDLSDTFYCGLRGAVTEMSLRLGEDVTDEDLTRSAPPGWRAGVPRGKIALAETGISLCRQDEWVQEDHGVPDLRRQTRQKPTSGRLRHRGRLDSSYNVPPGP